MFRLMKYLQHEPTMGGASPKNCNVPPRSRCREKPAISTPTPAPFLQNKAIPTSGKDIAGSFKRQLCGRVASLMSSSFLHFLRRGGRCFLLSAPITVDATVSAATNTHQHREQRREWGLGLRFRVVGSVYYGGLNND